MYQLLRPLLFCLDPETSHELALGLLAKVSTSAIALRQCQRLYANKLPPLPHQVMGIKFANPLGLAAGLDKQGNCANGLAAMGFGWVELGTVTPQPQRGNDKPRMFRLTSHDAIINRMGFNSIGLDAFLDNVKRTSPEIVKGINIGKNALTAVDDAASDYLTCMEAVYPHADYIAVNISSPNTLDLRSLQQDDALDALLGAINQKRQELSQTHSRAVPLVLKIAPDLDNDQVEVIARLLRKHHIDGIAATNTTIDKSAVEGHPHAGETGGLSGPAVAPMSNKVIAGLHQNLQGEIPIIGVGGIDSPTTAIAKLQAGAELLQLYTGFIYHGPKLVKNIVQSLAQKSGGNFESYLSTLHHKR